MRVVTKIGLAVLVATTFGAGAVQAATITETLQDTGYLTTDLASVPLSLTLFNSNLGTLTGVSVTVTGAMTSSGTVENTSAAAGNFTAKEDVAFSFTDTGNGSPFQALLNQLNSGNGLDPQVQQAYTAAAVGAILAFGPKSQSASGTQTTSTGLSAYEAAGGGTDLIDVSTLTGEGASGVGGNVAFVLATQADATVSITYTYTPTVTSVVEPGSLMLLGSGLLGLGALRRRRKGASQAA